MASWEGREDMVFVSRVWLCEMGLDRMRSLMIHSNDGKLVLKRLLFTDPTIYIRNPVLVQNATERNEVWIIA